MTLYVVLIWIGIPKPYLQHSRLAAGVFVSANQPAFLQKGHSGGPKQYFVDICDDCVVFEKHEIDAERTFMQRSFRNSS